MRLKKIIVLDLKTILLITILRKNVFYFIFNKIILLSFVKTTLYVYIYVEFC